MEKLIYIPSLHRPFNQQLKTTKWVCQFISSRTTKVLSSELNSDFYYYLIKFLQREYKRHIPSEFNGLPSDVAVNNIYSYMKSISKKQFIAELPKIISNRKSSLEKQIYSTYKAASYYVNLAKDKFKLIDEKNELTRNGIELIGIKSNNFKLASKEKEFFFERILEVDFHLFITHCLFARLEKKYDLKKIIDDELVFIDKFLNIKHFNFTSSSLENYNIVRAFWVNVLGVLDKNKNIRSRFLKLITNNTTFTDQFVEINSLFQRFEKENFKSKKKYLLNKSKFIETYRTRLKNDVSDLGYINLYDIKNYMRISQEGFQTFLNEFYEYEKNNLSIFFSNTVNSIDRRERFLIRNRPVIKIKIK